MELHTMGIDLGKTVFHLVGVNLRGEVVVRKRFSRKQLLHFTANLRVRLICGGLAWRCKILDHKRELPSAALGIKYHSEKKSPVANPTSTEGYC